ncbi:hypothetical protein M0P65_05495 [Candidatus Gracilibacteria bacterium]|nr:hypothetical protein [Candidatus Gracilibacteria bacterium]
MFIYAKTHDSKDKKARVAFLVKNEIISEEVGKVVFHASFPKGDENYINRSEACRQFIDSEKGVNKYVSAGGPAIERILNLEHHEGVTRWETEEVEPVAQAARLSDADNLPARGRHPGTKNRDKAVIEAEKALKVIRVEARKSLGLPARGRLTADQLLQLESYVKANLSTTTNPA